MGWEWHDRERDRYGRFAARHRRDQLHLRMEPAKIALIRNAARAASMEVSAYVWYVLDAYWAAQITENGENVATSGAAPARGPGPLGSGEPPLQEAGH